MAYIYKKTINGKDYYYLRASKREGSKVIAKDIAYLGSTMEEAKKSIERLPAKEIRTAYKTISRFFETGKWLEDARKLEVKHSEFIEKPLLEQVEAAKLHWEKSFQKRDPLTKKETLHNFAIEFAFNTTSIEGNTITLKEAARLLTENLTPKNREMREIYDVQNTERVLLSIIEKQEKLSNELIITIHDELMRSIDNRTGYRTEDVRVLHSHFDASPAQYVKTDMSLLLKWLEENKGKLHPLVLGSIFHHRFEKIHPFFDGNGRTGRMCLNAILLSSGYPPVIIRKKNRAAYLNALGEADKAKGIEVGHYRHLAEFIAAEFVDNYWNCFL